MKKVLLPFAFASSAFVLVGCSHSETDIKSSGVETITVYYKDVSLDWSDHSFSHGGYTITIPEEWGYGIKGKRSLFEGYDPHDIEFKYTVTTYVTYGGESSKKAEFKELIYREPKKHSNIFEISVVGLDLDSKVLVKDEWVNDCYFKYDTNADFYNFCYFKMAKNDINQLKEGYFNQINAKLDYYSHIDSSKSFVILEEKDGLNNVGCYSNVFISHNPDLAQ